MSIIVSRIEQRMLDEGISQFTTADMNALIIAIARATSTIFTNVTSDVILQRHKDLQIANLSDSCGETIVGGFTSSNAHKYRLNSDDQINMMGYRNKIRDDSTITTIEWLTLDAGYLEHNVSDWITQVYEEGFNFKDTTLTKYKNLKLQVEGVTVVNADYVSTHDQIKAVVWG